MSGPLTPLRSAPFRWLVAGATVSRLGSAIAPIALAFAILDLTGSSTDLGIVVGSRSLAMVAFLLLGGAVADRLPRLVVLLSSAVISAVTQAAVALLIFHHVGSVAALAGLSAVNGMASAFEQPAATALLPETVDADDLVAANALSRMGVNAAGVLGTAVAGVLIAAFGSAWGIAVDAGSFAASAALLALVRVPNPSRAALKAAVTKGTGDKAPPSTPAPQPNSVLRDIALGWSEFIRRTWLWVVVAGFTVLNAACVGGIAVLGPVIADETFGRRLWGLILAVQAIGFLVGGVFALRFEPARPLLVAMIVVSAQALPLFALGLSASVGIVLAASFVAGLGVEQFGVLWQTVMQRHVPAEMLARVSSYDLLGSFIAIPVGEVVAGPLGHVLGVRPAVFLDAMLVAAAALLPLASRSVRQLPQHPPSPG